jgi:hypothetical protein
MADPFVIFRNRSGGFRRGFERRSEGLSLFGNKGV